MSVYSQRTRRSATPSSILKKSKNLKTRISEIKQTPSKVRFVLPHSQKVHDILEEYVTTQVSRDYENILCLIRDAELTDEDVSSLLKEATECISLLNRDLRLFVEAVLSIDWMNKSDTVVCEYQSFIVNLLSAHNYHSKMVIEKLVNLFLPGPTEPDWPEGEPTDVDQYKFSSIHALLKLLLDVVPMCKEILINTICNKFPYYNKSTHIHEYYVHNILKISDYQPYLRPVILKLLFAKLVIMDVNAPREEIEKIQKDDEEMFLMEDDTKSVRTSTTAFTRVNRHELAHTLDICLDKAFNYFTAEIQNPRTGDLDLDKLRNLFEEMLAVFEQIILPTYDTHHVQYAMFFLCSFSTSVSDLFLSFLWKLVSNPNKAPIVRQATVNYLTSFMARANFISVRTIKLTLKNMVNWIHNYISAQDELGVVNSDVRIHKVFYSICQALFYVVAFRHKDFVESKRNMVFLQNLNLGRIVTSRLNPLRVCQPAVVQNFAAVTRTYQLAYCYTVIEHNTRNTMPIVYQSEQGTVVTSNNILDSVFPFDPYVLERSGTRIQPFYKKYQETNVEEMEVDVRENTDIDDFLYNHELSTTPNNKNHKFSYGSSPGFKFKG